VATIQSILLNGMLPDDLDEPSSILLVTCRNNQPFIQVRADLAPADGSCDAKISANTETLSIIFDAVRVSAV
jgi:hypothetical protein